MPSTFPRVGRVRPGYKPDEVDRFLKEARRAYDAPPGSRGGIDAEEIRRTAFAMEKGGYSPSHVDAALDRLEDAFASRERDHVLRTRGERAWFGGARDTAKDILSRLERPEGDRFQRAGAVRLGYHRGEVDAFCERLHAFFQTGRPIDVKDVRSVAFRARRNGYSEAQVDLFLDVVVKVMLAVR